MNQTTEALYLSMLDNGKLDTAETEKAFYRAYDYIIDAAECDDNEEEKSSVSVGNAHSVRPAPTVTESR